MRILVLGIVKVPTNRAGTEDKIVVAGKTEEFGNAAVELVVVIALVAVVAMASVSGFSLKVGEGLRMGGGSLGTTENPLGGSINRNTRVGGITDPEETDVF